MIERVFATFQVLDGFDSLLCAQTGQFGRRDGFGATRKQPPATGGWPNCASRPHGKPCGLSATWPTMRKIFAFLEECPGELEGADALTPTIRKVAAISVACNALCLAGAAVAAGTEPPECNDATSLRDAKRQYQGLEEQKQNLKIKGFSDIKQIRLGPPPASVNQYATKTSYATASRWCQATAALSNGKTDTLYWRMDYLVDGKGFSINLEHCATNHDLLDSNCQKLRAGK